MIINVMLKDPDGVYESLEDIDKDLRTKILDKFFECEEYVNIQINTETMQATIIELM